MQTKPCVKRLLRLSETKVRLVLNQTSFALGASDGAREDPEREGEQHGEEDEESEERLSSFGERLTLNEDAAYAVDAVGRRDKARDYTEAAPGELRKELGGEEEAGEERGACADDDAERIAALEDHREAGREYADGGEDERRQE